MEIKQRPVSLIAKCCRCGKSLRYRTVTYEEYDDDGNLIRMYDKLSSRDTNYQCLECKNELWKRQIEGDK